MLSTSIPSPDLSWSSFSIGPFTIHIYALCILVGIAVAAYITDIRLQRRGVAKGTVLDIVIWAVPLGIVGARFYHVFTHAGNYFYEGANLWKIFAIWDGGNALYGSLIGGAVGAWIACRQTHLRLLTFADALAPGLLVAQAIGRLGNWFNNELFGVPTTLPWGLEISPDAAMYPAGTPAGTLFHPLFLYEMIWNLVGAVIIVLLGKKFNMQWGRSFAFYLIWYGSGRAFLESIRIDPTSNAPMGLPINVWVSMGVILIGFTIYGIQSQHLLPEPSPYLPGKLAEVKQKQSEDNEKKASEKSSNKRSSNKKSKDADNKKASDQDNSNK